MIRVDRKLGSTDVLDASTDLFIRRGPPDEMRSDNIRSDNGPEFIARKVPGRIAAAGAKTAQVEPGKPTQNAYIESFNGRFRDEFLRS